MQQPIVGCDDAESRRTPFLPGGLSRSLIRKLGLPRVRAKRPLKFVDVTGDVIGCLEIRALYPVIQANLPSLIAGV